MELHDASETLTVYPGPCHPRHSRPPDPVTQTFPAHQLHPPQFNNPR